LRVVFSLQSVTWNGQPVAGATVSYFDLMKGGTLQFNMTATPPAGAKVPAHGMLMGNGRSRPHSSVTKAAHRLRRRGE
jgi:putative alpha-1,2-mannosidase